MPLKLQGESLPLPSLGEALGLEEGHFARKVADVLFPGSKTPQQVGELLNSSLPLEPLLTGGQYYRYLKGLYPKGEFGAVSRSKLKRLARTAVNKVLEGVKAVRETEFPDELPKNAMGVFKAEFPEGAIGMKSRARYQPIPGTIAVKSGVPVSTMEHELGHSAMGIMSEDEFGRLINLANKHSDVVVDFSKKTHTWFSTPDEFVVQALAELRLRQAGLPNHFDMLPSKIQDIIRQFYSRINK